jgi:hypothetical protein
MLVADTAAVAPPADRVVVPIEAVKSVAPPPAPALAPSTRWYGGPAVAAEIAEVALLYGVTRYAEGRTRTPGSRTAATLLMISALTSGAVAHRLHHHGGRAAGSIALRAGSLLAGVLVAEWYLNRHCNLEEGICSGSPALGDLAGAAIIGLPLAVMAFDDAFLAREPVPSAAPAKASWIPTLRIQQGLALLGVSSSF